MPFLIGEALNTGKTSDTHLIFITAAAIVAGAAVKAAAEAAARSCDAAFPTQQYNVHPRIGPLRSRSPANASLSVWRTVRGLRYYQIWEMVLLAAGTAGYLPVQRRTVCLTNHRVSIHGALSSTRLQPGVA